MLYKDIDCLKGKNIECVMELFCDRSDQKLFYKHLKSGAFGDKKTICDCRIINLNSFTMLFKDEISTNIAQAGKMIIH